MSNRKNKYFIYPWLGLFLFMIMIIKGLLPVPVQLNPIYFTSAKWNAIWRPTSCTTSISSASARFLRFLRSAFFVVFFALNMVTSYLSSCWGHVVSSNAASSQLKRWRHWFHWLWASTRMFASSGALNTKFYSNPIYGQTARIVWVSNSIAAVNNALSRISIKETSR